MRIVMCGPPHSGKSVFVDNLSKLLPTNGLVIIRACPDGEGRSSSGPNRELVELVRQKGKFDREFIDNVCEVIDKHADSRIVLVDVGGRISMENKKIFEHCDGYIVLHRDTPDEKLPQNLQTTPEDWVKVCEKKGLKQVALLRSTMTKGDKLNTRIDATKDDPIVGRLSGLNRGANITESLVLRAVGRHICYLTRDVVVDNSFLDIDGSKLAQVLDYIITGNVNEGKDNKIVQWDLSAIRKIYDFIERPQSLLEEVDKRKSKKKQKKLLKPFMRLDDLVEDVRMNANALANEGRNLEERPLEITVGKIYDNHIMMALCFALKQKGIQDIYIYDSIRKEKYLVQELNEREGRLTCNSENVFALKVESQSSVFMDIDIINKKMSQKDYESITIPKVNSSKALYLSGEMPQWLFASICISSGAKEVYVLNRGLGFICVKSDDKDNLGKVQDQYKVPEIDVKKYFEMKKSKSLPPDLRLEEDLIEPEDRCEVSDTQIDFISRIEHEDVMPIDAFAGKEGHGKMHDVGAKTIPGEGRRMLSKSRQEMQDRISNAHIARNRLKEILDETDKRKGMKR